MDAHELTEGFLKSVEALEGAQDGKWAFDDFKTPHGIERRNGFLDACSEMFVPFVGHPKTVIYEAIQEAFRRKGSNYAVQRYGGMLLLNLVPDAYGQVDELIEIISPVYDVSNREIPAFLVEQVGIEPLLLKIESRVTSAPENVRSRLNGLAYQAKVYCKTVNPCENTEPGE